MIPYRNIKNNNLKRAKTEKFVFLPAYNRKLPHRHLLSIRPINIIPVQFQTYKQNAARPGCISVCFLYFTRTVI